MTLRPTILVLLLPLLAACGAGRRTSGNAGGAGGGTYPTSPSAAGDSATGGRWYGYEGGLRDAEAAARSIEGATQYWSEVRASWQADPDTGSLVAHFQERRLRRIAITYAAGRTTGTGAYTYDERARLFHYQGEERRRTGTGRNARTERATVSIALDPRGTTSAARKTVGRSVQALRPEEVQAIITREIIVRRAAVDALTERR